MAARKGAADNGGTPVDVARMVGRGLRAGFFMLAKLLSFAQTAPEGPPVESAQAAPEIRTLPRPLVLLP